MLEIVAGRLLAPYVGVSLYTWTSIIGVILAGLSLGNWLGGRWADRRGGEPAVAAALGLAGLASLAVLLLLSLLAPWLQQSGLDLLSASVLYVAALFLLPALLLGLVTPLLTTLALRLDRRAGRVVGRMHALAALGSIAGTFLTGFVLVQYLGSRLIVTATGVLLLLLALPFAFGRGSGPEPAPVAWKRQRLLLLIFAGATAALTLVTAARQGFASPCQRESRYFCIRVVGGAGPGAEPGAVRTLVLDHLAHGSSHSADPTLLLSSYAHLADELTRAYFPAARRRTLRYFFVGGGAYSQPRAVLAATPRASVTVAELDPAVTAVARDALFAPPAGARLRVVHGDARVALQRTPPRAFDVVVTDAFHDISVPYHLLTREFAALVRSRLAPDGLYVANVVDLFPSPHLVKSLYRTLRAEFRHVQVWLEHLPGQPTRMTFMLSASNARPLPLQLEASNGLRRRWYAVTEPLLQTSPPPARLPLLTDDYVPVERLLARLLSGSAGL